MALKSLQGHQARWMERRDGSKPFRLSEVLVVISVLCSLPYLRGVPVASLREVPDPLEFVATSDVIVNVAVYYEALCPSSREFIAQLAPAAELLAPITSLSLYPYGNAHPSNASAACSTCDPCNVWECNVTCQHGVQECKLNLAQACLLSFVPAVAALPAIRCIETSPLPFSWCIAKHAPNGVAVSLQVKTCMISPLGKHIQEEMASATLSLLSPPKQFVPWVTVDKVPLVDDYKDIVSAVCGAYKARGGVTPPAVCTDKSLINTAGHSASAPHGNKTIIYTRCRLLKVLGEVCISVYEESSNTTSSSSLGVLLDLSGPGLEIDIPLLSSEVCVSDQQLLELLLVVPELKPFEKEIRKLIEARGFIPAEIFSECVRLYNVTGSGRNVSGCVALDSRLMCFKAKCLYKASDPFGCFHRPPAPGPRAAAAAAVAAAGRLPAEAEAAAPCFATGAPTGGDGGPE